MKKLRNFLLRAAPWRAGRKFASGLPKLVGYENPSLIDVVVHKTAALAEAARIDDVQAGETLLPSIAGVSSTASRGPLRVIDLGGAAGLHYRVVKQVFPSREFRWAIVETPAMVAATAKFESEELRFFTSIEAAHEWLGAVELLHCVSALQYMPEPEDTLAKLLQLDAGTMLWVKLMLGRNRQSFMQSSQLRDNGPGPLVAAVADREVAYSATSMRRDDFLAAHQSSGYRLAWKASESYTYMFFKENTR